MKNKAVFGNLPFKSENFTYFDFQNNIKKTLAVQCV